MLGRGPVIDWTNGSGVFPASGSITIPQNTELQWLFVENRDLGEITIAYATNYANGNGNGTVLISLDPAVASGRQGGNEERNIQQFIPYGPIIITGTSGQKVAILTG